MQVGKEKSHTKKVVAGTFQVERKQELKNKEESFWGENNPLCLPHTTNAKEIEQSYLTKRTFGLSESINSNLGPRYPTY